MTQTFSGEKTHRSSFTWDAHAGFSPSADLDLSFLKRWRASGVDHVSINVGYDVMQWDETLANVAHYRKWLFEHSGDFLLAERFEDLRLAKSRGKLAVTFDLEGANALNDSIDMIGVYRQLGVRQMNLAYNRNNAFGGGCHDEDIGLTGLGQHAVAEMNRVGMIVDCTHTGYRTSMDIMALSAKPVIFSHSNAYGVCAHGRNIKDDQIRECAMTGGVVCLNGVSIFLEESTSAVSAMIDHVDYIASLVGTRHVGIGLDTVVDPTEMPRLAAKYPEAWPNYAESDMEKLTFVPPEKFGELAEGLARRGYSSLEMTAIMGENMLRVASEVW